MTVNSDKNMAGLKLALAQILADMTIHHAEYTTQEVELYATIVATIEEFIFGRPKAKHLGDLIVWLSCADPSDAMSIAIAKKFNDYEDQVSSQINIPMAVPGSKEIN